MDPHADPLKGIDMTQLHRCIQMHACLQKIPSLQARTLYSLPHPHLCQRQRCPVEQQTPCTASSAHSGRIRTRLCGFWWVQPMDAHRSDLLSAQGYYQVNRRMQLNNDLAAQGNFVAQPQAYLAQLVGFFVIENRVGRTAEALSAAQVQKLASAASSCDPEQSGVSSSRHAVHQRVRCAGQVDAGWDTAVAYLKLAMDTAFETISSAASMLLIKDLVLLVSSALGAVQFSNSLSHKRPA